MSNLEYLVASLGLRILGWLFDRLPGRPRRVVLASPRKPVLDGNLLHIRRAIAETHPDVEIVELPEPYSYGFAGKVAYAFRVARGMYHLHTADLVVIDNAWLPVHVAPHPPRTTVVQVWHAAGALKRFGMDSLPPPTEPERTFLHRHYDWVVTAGEASREPWSRALRTPPQRVIALGSARTDPFFDERRVAEARARVVARYPALAGRRVITYAPTFRGRGREKHPAAGAAGLDARALRAALGSGDAVVLKSHPNLDPRLVDTVGFDVVVDPADDMNELLAATDILVTDYSSSIFDWVLLRRPLVLLVPDLAEYEREPGLYLDFHREMVGTQVADTDGVIATILGQRFDIGAYDAFIARHLGASDGHASARMVDRFVPAGGLPGRVS